MHKQDPGHVPLIPTQLLHIIGQEEELKQDYVVLNTHVWIGGQHGVS